MSLEIFAAKLKQYCRLTGNSLKTLAHELDINSSLLSHKLNGTSNRTLTHTEAKQIIKVLAGWEALVSRAEAEGLLELLGYPAFSEAEWNTSPLDRLEITKSYSRPAPNLEVVKTSLAKVSFSGITRKVSEDSNNNLPLHLSSFIGRSGEIVEIKKRLRANRLLTLTGTGGVGKTRLSQQVAGDLLDDFKAGVWLVELAPISDPALVPQAIALALKVKEIPGQPLLAALQHYLSERQLLLLLDNCEHLVEIVALVSEKLLVSCPGLKILATSREPLGVPGEINWGVPALTIPTSEPTAPNLSETSRLAQFEAVQLFLERAKTVQPTFELTNQNSQALIQICQRLDGIPLALELAAAKVRGLTVQEIANRLDDRFRLLNSGPRTALPRQKTLYDLIDWSFRLLSEPEKILLRRLSIFTGGWTLEAAEAVCLAESTASELDLGEILELLLQLVNKSMLVTEQQGEETRYNFLETIRQFAREKLKESRETDLISYRHCRYFLSLAEKAEPELIGEQQKQWLDRLEQELDNLRTSLKWSLEQAASNYEAAPPWLTLAPADMGLALCASLWRFWLARNYFSEGINWLVLAVNKNQAELITQAGSIEITSDFLPEPGLEPQKVASRAKALNGLGVLARNQSNFRLSQVALEKSMELYRRLDNKTGLAQTLNSLGTLANYLSNYEQAKAYFEGSLKLQRQLNNKRGVTVAAVNLGTILFEQEGKFLEAQALFEEGESFFRALGDKRSLALVLIYLGTALGYQGDYPKAKAVFEESLELWEEVEDKHGVAHCRGKLADVMYYHQDYEAALDYYRQVFDIFEELGDERGLFGAMEGLAAVAAGMGFFTHGACLEGAAKALREATGVSISYTEKLTFEKLLTTLKANLSETEFTNAWNTGRAMSKEQAIAYIRTEVAVFLPDALSRFPSPTKQVSPSNAGLVKPRFVRRS